MRFLSVAVFVVFLCAAVVFAAPSTLNPSLEQLTTEYFQYTVDEPFESNNLEYLKLMKCVTSGCEKSVKGTKLSKLYDFFALLINHQIAAMETCMRDKEGADQDVCFNNHYKKAMIEVLAFLASAAKVDYEFGQKLVEILKVCKTQA